MGTVFALIAIALAITGSTIGLAIFAVLAILWEILVFFAAGRGA